MKPFVILLIGSVVTAVVAAVTQHLLPGWETGVTFGCGVYVGQRYKIAQHAAVVDAFRSEL